MKPATLLASLKRKIPEFTADDLFLDPPYVVFGGFAEFLVDRMRAFGTEDPVVQRSFAFVNDIFFEGDREMINIVETTLFEQLAGDPQLSRAAETLLEAPARASLNDMSRADSYYGPVRATLRHHVTGDPSRNTARLAAPVAEATFTKNGMVQLAPRQGVTPVERSR